MIIVSPELTKFVPLKWELNPFDLKLIDTISRKHPFQHTIFILNKYSGDFLYNDDYDNDEYFKTDYFDLLDKYYRYGISFEDDQIYFKNFLCVEEYSDEISILRYIIPNRNLYDLKIVIFNDVKKINLNDLDKGPITLSEIEKWKRKVINQQTDRMSKLRLLDPNVYHSLITFVVFFLNLKIDHLKRLIIILVMMDQLNMIERIIKVCIIIQKFMRIRFIIRLSCLSSNIREIPILVSCV